MSLPRWDSLADWDAHELLDAYGELRDAMQETDPPFDHVERRFLVVREEILRRCEPPA